MTSMLEQHGLVAVVGDLQHLVGSRCTACATHTFPSQTSCPRCAADTELVALPNEGSLWSWTVQRIQPKPPYRGPDVFEPFALGYVDLGPIRIESRLAGKPVDAWAIGDRVRMVVGAPDAEGDVWSFRFEHEESAA